MAYLALARKWRPKAFSEVVGQQHVVQALSNALNTGRVHHAFLFTGTRGVGKTTLARIFAKSLNCEQGTSAEPCQQCSTCQSIDEGRFVDLIEVDAASRTKVDDTRELLENVQYAPTSGKFKVYLIDEVHMLSGHSFNALLKTLEEPPEHVKFLFATTDPQKLPVTVLSRCLQFNLRAMRPEQVENQLVKILGNESIEFDNAALQAIAKAADGSMRDGLSLLDQAIAQGGGEVRTNDVHSMLGTIKTEHTLNIISALLNSDVEQALRVVGEMADSAVDFAVALDEVLMQLYYVSLVQVSPSSLQAVDADTGKVAEWAKAIAPETIQLFYQIGLISKRDINLAPSLRVGFEMALLRMFAFEPSELEPAAVPIPESVATLVENQAEKKTLEQAADQPISSPVDLHTQTIAPAAQAPEIQSNEPLQQKPEQEVPKEMSLEPKPSELLPPELRQNSPQELPTAPTTPHPEALPVSDIPSQAVPSQTIVESNEARSNHVASPVESAAPQAATPPWEDTPQQSETDPPQTISGSTPQFGGRSPQLDRMSPQPRITSSQSDREAEPRPSDQTSAATGIASANQSAPSLIAVTLAGNNEWGELVEQTALQGMAKELAMNCAADRINEQRIDLCLSPKLEHLFDQQRFDDIQAAVKAVTNAQLAVSLDIDNSDRETPAECLARLGYEHEEQVRDAMHNDPGAQSIMSEFGAKIKENSIKPL